MTVIAALKREDEIWMASDQETTYYDLGRADQLNASKIIPYKNALIATSGMALFKNALRYYAATKKEAYKAKFESETDVMDFFFKFHAFMKEKYGMGNAKNDEVEKLSHNSFMVVTHELIYQVSCARDVATYQNFTAIGNGSEIVLGAIHALLPIIDSPAQILEKALAASCHFKHGCGGEIELVHVPSALKPKRHGRSKSHAAVKLITGKTKRSARSR